jgi:hypothetical protein
MTELHVDTARIGGWMFIHTANSSTIHFGPFADYEELRMWLETIGDENEVTGVAVPLVNPASDPDKFGDRLYSLVETTNA